MKNLFKKSKEKIKKVFSNPGENMFHLVFGIITLVILAVAFGAQIPAMQIIGIALMRVSIYLVTLTFFFKFLLGMNRNLWKEIFEEGNIAASIILAGIALGLAIVIAIAI